MRFYTVLETAKLLKVHPETVRRWIRESKIGSFAGIGRQGYRITDEHLRDFIKKNPATVTPELLNELGQTERAEASGVAKNDSQDLDALVALRLKKLEELQQLDVMIIQKKLGK